jgi:hypothetical protein
MLSHESERSLNREIPDISGYNWKNENEANKNARKKKEYSSYTLYTWMSVLLRSEAPALILFG